MLDGWYCRSIANANNIEDDDEPDESVKSKTQYRNLKRKLKYLIYVMCTAFLVTRYSTRYIVFLGE